VDDNYFSLPGTSIVADHSFADDPRFSFELHDICRPFDFGSVDFIYEFASPANPVAVDCIKLDQVQGGEGLYYALW
jgi:hypothetical protein